MIEVLESVPSTQSEALSRLRTGDLGPRWIQAQRQTAGIGRMGRAWESQSGNLMSSWYGVLPIELRQVTQLSFVTALAVTDLVRPLLRTPEALKIKWPNDVLYGGGKLCGILVQTEMVDAGLGIVIGVGLNVTQTPRIDAYATTAINDIAFESHNAAHLLEQLDPLFQRRIDLWLENGFEVTAQEWFAQAYGRDLICLIKPDNQTIEGMILGLDAFGMLRVQDHEGRVHTIASGSVTYTDVPCS